MRDTPDVIDRRGARSGRGLPFPGGIRAGGGIGLVGLLVFLAIQLIGGGGAGTAFDVDNQFGDQVEAPGSGAIPADQDPERDLKDFSAYVFTRAQSMWVPHALGAGKDVGAEVLQVALGILIGGDRTAARRLHLVPELVVDVECRPSATAADQLDRQEDEQPDQANAAAGPDPARERQAAAGARAAPVDHIRGVAHPPPAHARSLCRKERGPGDAGPSLSPYDLLGAGGLRLVVLPHRLRHALAEGIALVLVRAVLRGEGSRVCLALRLALLGGVLDLVCGRCLQLALRLRDALAERVLAVLVAAVLGGEGSWVGLALGLALLHCVRVNLVHRARVFRHTLAIGVALLLVRAERLLERRDAHLGPKGLTELRSVLEVRLRDGRRRGRRHCQGPEGHANDP